MNSALKVAIVGEGLTGLALLVAPSLVERLLLTAEMTGAALATARVAGIALIGLSVACVPGRAVAGMLTYSVLATLYLAWLGVAGGFAGPLLWPAVGLHLVLTILLARAFIAEKKLLVSPRDSGKTPETEPTKEPHS